MADKKFIDEVLAAHNHYRGLHQVPPVTVNPKLNKFAQDWADHLAKTDSFAHSKCDLNGTRLGENIAMKMSSNAQDYKGKDFVDQWYSEVERYDFKKHGGPSTGHFSQVVWKGSKEIGVGRAILKGGQKVIVVGSYSPAGNMMGDNNKNVFPTKDGKITLPEKGGPPKGALKPGSAGKGRPVSPGRVGGPSLSKPPPAGIPAGYTSVSRETMTRRGPDGKTETTVKETYSYPDGSKRTVEKREIKSDGTPGKITPPAQDLEKRMNDMKMNAANRPGSGSKSSSSNAAFIDEALAAHNRYRAKHGAPALKHNKKLSGIAQGWADHLAKTGEFKHSTNKFQGNNLGENIASKMSSSGADYDGQAVTDQWYSEEKDYSYGNQESMGKSGHFTQVVWKGSKLIGLGKATKKGKTYVVANYSPAGNFQKKFKENVGRPKK
ncbi:uncharacterized protein LOC135501634 isoform X2 [Lineus longissimus]|uniref:uncharacterized protein LOC135501634 isoform X2 n=1 Tax=Lineus longissimus TaxID=88925 RepID=UPI00315DF019